MEITVQTKVKKPVDKVWEFWTTPKHITKWNQASSDWHTPRAENDLRTGGKFLYRMEAKDKSFGFDFYGVYESVNINQSIESTLGDGRKMKVVFTRSGNETNIIETFEAEPENPPEIQKNGWQAILDSFKSYAEAS